MTGDTHPRDYLAALLRIVEERAGLVLRATRWGEFQQVVADAIVRTGARNEWEYVERARSEPAVFEALVARLVIHETYFFRESRQIQELRERVIPALAERRGKLRVWSAGCASGEEAYTLSILFAEMGLADRLQVLGTDVSPKAVATAREATYRQWSFRGVHASTIARYFDEVEEGRYRVRDEIRKPVRFEQHNLASDEFPPVAMGAGADLVLCRNVLLYFSRERARDVGEGLMASLAPGGVLIIGPSDPMLRCDPPMEAVATPGGLLYRRTVNVLPPPRRSSPPQDGHRFESGTRAATDFATSIEVPAFPISADAFAETPRALPVKPLSDANLSDAVTAFAGGDYARVLELTTAVESADAAVLRVRALANFEGTGAAVDECERLLQSHRFDPELAYLRATLLLDLGRLQDAYAASRELVFLDRSLEVGHFLMGTIALRRGDIPEAQRAFRHAHRVASARPAEDPVPLGEGQSAGALAQVALDWIQHCEVAS